MDSRCGQRGALNNTVYVTQTENFLSKVMHWKLFAPQGYFLRKGSFSDFQLGNLL
jgi:hypothetical protein